MKRSRFRLPPHRGTTSTTDAAYPKLCPVGTPSARRDERFANEARAMHYGDKEHRPIYGEASPEEAKSLIDEGIEVSPLPTLPEDRN